MTTDAERENFLAIHNLKKGNEPLSIAAFTRKAQRIQLNVWPKARQDRFHDEYSIWRDTEAPNLVALGQAINIFNTQLFEYRNAVERLNRYILSEGRQEITEQQETGELDENGNPLTEEVIVQYAIDPLPLQITAHDEEGNEIQIDNPVIVADVAERVEKQLIIDQTPQEVIDWYNQH